MKSANVRLNEALDNLVRIAQQDSPMTTQVQGPVAIRRNAKGSIRLTYTVTHYIESDHERAERERRGELERQKVASDFPAPFTKG